MCKLYVKQYKTICKTIQTAGTTNINAWFIILECNNNNNNNNNDLITAYLQSSSTSANLTNINILLKIFTYYI